MNTANTKGRILSVRMILTIVVMAAGIAVALAKPFDGLGGTGHAMLGTMLAALATWMFRPGGGTFIAGALIVLLGGTLAGIPMTDLASGFSSASLWLLIPAMFLGYALLKTGLGKRLVFALLGRLNLTYPKILVGWLILGSLFALLTPSITVRFLILSPIAVSVADACCLPNGSRGRSLIIISAWTVSIFPGISWLSGSLYGPVFTSYLPGAMQEMATEAMWSRVMAAPWMLLSVLFLVVMYFVLKPEQKLTVTKERLKSMYKELGPISSAEKRCLAVFILLLVSLALQGVLGYTTNQALLAMFALLLLFGVLSIGDISQGISWDTVVFFGIVLSFSSIFETAGITAWLSPILSSLLDPIAGSHLGFLLALYAICVLLRFLDIAQGWIISAILAMATPMLFTDFGIPPLVCIMVFICASNQFLFRYQQPWVVQIEAVCGEKGWNPKHLTKASIVYLVLAGVMLVFCSFYWSAIGVW